MITEAGNSHNSKCPPNDSLTWCAGYKVGYEVGWAAVICIRELTLQRIMIIIVLVVLCGNFSATFIHSFTPDFPKI